MSNYTNENLINVPASSVPAGTLAIKVGDNIFTAGNVVIGTNVSDTTAGAADAPFKLVKITNFTSPKAAYTAATSITLSGFGISENQNDYSDLNGTYNVTAATAEEQDPFARVYKHTSAQRYLYFYSEYGQSYWCLAQSAGAYPYSARMVIYTDPAAQLTDGTATWYNTDWGQNQTPTAVITRVSYPAVQFSLTARKVTGFTDTDIFRQYSTSTSTSDFDLDSVYYDMPSINKLGIINDNKLICMTQLATTQILLPVKDFIWGYYGGRMFGNIVATNYGVISDSDGYFILGQDKYFDFNTTFLTGNSPRTFIFQATVSDSTAQFFDGGSSGYASGYLGFGWGRSGNYLFRHFFDNDDAQWLALDPGSYILAFIADGSTLKVYKNGQQLGKLNSSLDTGTDRPYRIGRSTIQDWGINGQWKSKFFAISDRALSQVQVAAVTSILQQYIPTTSESIES